MIGKVTRAQALRIFSFSALAAATFLPATAAFADDAVKLFKIVSPKDEIIIGVLERDLATVPDRGDLARFTSKFKAAGQIEVWRYAVKKASNGDLVQDPAMRVMLVWSEVLRIEPYASPLKVNSPS